MSDEDSFEVNDSVSFIENSFDSSASSNDQLKSWRDHSKAASNHSLSSDDDSSSSSDHSSSDDDIVDVSSEVEAIKPLVKQSYATAYQSPLNQKPFISNNNIKQEFPSENGVEIKKESLLENDIKQESLIENVDIKDEFAKSNKIKVSSLDYNDQKRLVQTLESDVLKSKNILRTVNLNDLPDKGKMLQDRHEYLLKSVQMAKDKLFAMDVDAEINVGNSTAKPLSWEDLQVGAAVVKPKTFGKQAMATYNNQKVLTMERLEHLHGSLKDCPSEDTYETDPVGLKVELMPHQKHAVAWLMWRERQKPSGGILADDMGLGKTLTMISLMLKKNQTKENRDVSDSDEEDVDKRRNTFNGGTLVVCPASVLNQWELEVRKRCRRGLAAVEVYHGPKRETKPKYLAKHDMVITTYAIVMNEYQRNGVIFKIRWSRVILDEAHQVRNHKSQTSVAVCNLASKSRWALTGTPIHNKELDLYALLKFLRCTPFDDLAVWKKWVTNKNSGGQQRLHTVISSILLRRTKAQLEEKGILTCLPQRNWETIKITLDKQETDVYQKVLILSRTLFAQFLHQRAEKDTNYEPLDQPPRFALPKDPNSKYYKMHKRLVKMNRVKEVKQHEILMLLLRLRQICCHPSLITSMLQGEHELDTSDDDVDGIEEMNILEQLNKLDINDDGQDDEAEVAKSTKGLLNPSNPIFAVDRRSSKVRAVLEIIKEKVLPQGDKCIVVSQWTSLLKLIAVCLDEEGIIYEQLDGSVNVHKRSLMVENFNNPTHQSNVLLLSLTAGGVGLNLIGANHLILVDLHWNPQLEMQAQDRIYRVGQMKTVNIYKFITADTIEERIKQLQEFKMSLATALLTGAKIEQTKLSLEDLKMLFNM